MRCPNPRCRDDAKQVVKQTKPEARRIVRKRLCEQCRGYYTTVEEIERGPISVIKRDGRIVAFNRQSLFESLREATTGWVGPDELDRIIDYVLDKAYVSGKGQAVSSAQIGALVLERLRAVNAVSHIRFALAYFGRRDRTGQGDHQGWADARDVREWLQREYTQLLHELVPAELSTVVKAKSGVRERFRRDTLKNSIAIAYKGRLPDGESDRRVSDVANEVEIALAGQPIVTTGQISAEVLRCLRRKDDIAYLRYASSVKTYLGASDYDAEAEALARERRQKHRPPA